MNFWLKLTLVVGIVLTQTNQQTPQPNTGGASGNTSPKDGANANASPNDGANANALPTDGTGPIFNTTDEDGGSVSLRLSPENEKAIMQPDETNPVIGDARAAKLHPTLSLTILSAGSKDDDNRPLTQIPSAVSNAASVLLIASGQNPHGPIHQLNSKTLVRIFSSNKENQKCLVDGRNSGKCGPGYEATSYRKVSNITSEKKNRNRNRNNESSSVGADTRSRDYSSENNQDSNEADNKKSSLLGSDSA